MFEAKVVLHSVTESGNEIVTFQLEYPRFIHSELMTHRVFSRNAMSSRAVPVAKMIEQVRADPAMPVHWGANQPGMQAKAEVANIFAAKFLWQKAAMDAANTAEKMVMLGLHKQVANRILEPFQWMRTIVTMTELSNFYDLRCHEDADPNFQKLACLMRNEEQSSSRQTLKPGEWHLPYISDDELKRSAPYDLRKVSAARCARVSYLTHEGKVPSLEADMALFERLAGGVPLHASPLEHQATPGEVDTGNFKHWTQFRKLWEKEIYA